MREILFRGKRIDNGEWVYGDIHKNKDFSKAHIHPVGKRVMSFGVIPETVGQYTGLTDKNSVKIFEGDIVRDDLCRIKGVTFYKGYYHPFICFPEYLCWYEDDCEVIGNLHDNPELLEEKS